MLTRRKFLHSMLAVSSLSAARCGFAQHPVPIRLRSASRTSVASLPLDFTGLGYEMSSAARPALFSPGNAVHIQLLRNLGHKGVLRFGGIVADYTTYSETGPSAAEPKNTVVTHADLQRLRKFLDATGWTAIWSVNFGRGTLEQALLEVRSVRSILGDRLLAIELGNEVENYGNGQSPARTPPYTFAAYRSQYDRWRAAILAAQPGLSFTAPDTAQSVEWVEQMAASARGDVQLLTTHYYRGGQKQATLDQLLSPDPELSARLQRLHRASIASGIPWRMCETNSFFGGGHPGLSDTFAGALWTLDYMLLLAQSGCAGVNIETGFNQLGFLSSYSPIRNDEQGNCIVGASYYGMLAFAAAKAANLSVFALHADGAPSQAAFYAFGAPTEIHSVVLINKTLDQPLRISLADLAIRSASCIRLTAPSAASKVDIKLGGSLVDADGSWKPEVSEPIESEILLPPCSAALLQRHQGSRG